MSDDGKKTPPAEVVFPFQRRQGDAGEWVFDHRAALMLTVVVILSLAILFVTSRIVIGQRKAAAVMVFEPEQRQRTPPPEQQPASVVQPDGGDYRDVRNRVSNENAATAASSSASRRLRDAKNTDVDELYREAAEVEERTRANREAYERGLASNASNAENARRAAGSPNAESYYGQGRAGGHSGRAAAEGEDTKVKGRVTASFSLVSPLRSSVRLYIPAYRCQGGGQVAVRIAVDRNGNVVSASVDRAVSSSDDCLTEMALDAAHRSRFNTDGSAPDPQHGNISYIFIPQ